MRNPTGRIRLTLLAAFSLLLLVSGIAAAQESKQFSLEDAYRIALEENEQVRISREDLRQAQTDITSATSNLYPQISARGAYTRQKTSDFGGASGFSVLQTPEEYGTLTLRLEQHVYQWGKVWSGRQIAEHYYKGSQFRHLRRVQEILYQVGTRYYEVLLGRRSIEIAENALKRAQKQQARARAQFEVGVLTQTDVLRAEVQVAQSREQLERAKNQYEIALERLALEMGIASVPGTLKEPEEKDFSRMPIAELYARALENRRDYEQAQKQLLATKERVKFEEADFFPNISVNGQYTRTDEEALFYGEDDDWEASVVLSYPLFTGWKRSAEIDRAKSEESQAQYALARLRKQIRNEVRSVYLDIQTQQKVIEQLEQQVQSAQRNYKQVTAQFEQGLVTAVDQVDAFTALNEAENRLAQAYYTYQLDLIRLKLATGTFQSDLLEKETLNENN